MADESQKPAATETAQTDDGKKAAETVAELAATKAALEEIKKAQAGSDAKVAKLLLELEQKNKATQTDAERLAALETKVHETEALAARKDWLAAGYKLATDRGLPTDMVDNYGGDKDKLVIFLDAMKKRDEELEARVATKLVTQTGHKPGSGTSAPGEPDLKAMSFRDRIKYFESEAAKRQTPTV